MVSNEFAYSIEESISQRRSIVEISVVIPVFNCNDSLHELYSRLKKSLESFTYEFEIILVLDDNCSFSWDTILNLDEKSVLENRTLKSSIEKNEINPQLLAFLKPQDIHPDHWKDLIRKTSLREEKKKNIAVTDLYQCNKCKERRCRMMEIQTAGADEPMTRFITCLNCYNVMKRR